jgi:hypothetical protein
MPSPVTLPIPKRRANRLELTPPTRAAGEMLDKLSTVNGG